VLRRLGRHADAAEAWSSLAAGPGRVAVFAATELAKLMEHRLGDPARALVATRRGLAQAARRRRLGHPEPRLEADLTRRATRLHRRLAAASRSSATARPEPPDRAPVRPRPGGAARGTTR
jgi:hypothetical protein